MKSVVKLDFNVARAELAGLIADPQTSPSWMEEVQRIERVSGKLGMPGSRYRLVPKRGGRAFVATVVSRDLPSKVKLSLEAPRVTVSVSNSLIPLSNNRTRLVSEEVFRFKGALSRAYGFLARPAIRRAHRRHMEALKKFAESVAKPQEPAPAEEAARE